VGLRGEPYGRVQAPRLPQVSCGHVPRRLRPASWLVHELAHDERGRLRRGALQGGRLAGVHARRPGSQDVQVARKRHRPQQGVRHPRCRCAPPVGRLRRHLNRRALRRHDPRPRG